MKLRKTGFAAGFLSIILAFIAGVPFSFSNETANSILNFSILIINNVEYFSWGYISDNIGYTSLGFNSIENFIAISIWLLFALPGLFGIMASSPKSIPEHSKKLFKLNVLFIFLILFIYTLNWILIIFTSSSSAFFGFGYYFQYIILVLNIISIKILKKS